MATRRKSRDIISFDECVATNPEVTPPEDFESVWKNRFEAFRKIPAGFHQRIMITRSLGREALYHLSFMGPSGRMIHGTLALPRGLKKRPVVLVLPDYLDTPPGSRPFTSLGLGHFVFDPPAQGAPGGTPGAGWTSPARESFESLESTRLYEMVMNLTRALEQIRSVKAVNPDALAIMAGGLMAGPAVLASASQREGLKALVLERPSTAWFDQWIEESTSYYGSELRKRLELEPPRNRSRIKKILSYMDPLNVAPRLKLPVLVSSCLEDRNNPARNVFALFNRFQTEKYMDLYMEESMDPDELKKRKRALEFLESRLLGEKKAFVDL